jgi:hypothetical protein
MPCVASQVMRSVPHIKKGSAGLNRSRMCDVVFMEAERRSITLDYRFIKRMWLAGAFSSTPLGTALVDTINARS